MGVDIEELPDGMTIRGGTPVQGAEIACFGDHRIAMAATVAAVASDSSSVIHNADSAAVSFPGFLTELQKLI